MDSDVQGEKPAGTVQETVSKEEQPLTKEAVDKMIADATAKATAETTRKMQSIKDREVAEVRRRFQSGGDSLTHLSDVTRGLDPEVAEKVELATLRAKEKSLSQRDAEENAKQQLRDMVISFTDNLTEYIQSENIDPSDKRIEWGKDDESLLVRQKKVLDSLAKIKKQEITKVEQKLKQQAKDLIDKERKEAGLEDIDTSLGGGSISVSVEKLGKKMDTREGIEELVKSGAVNKYFQAWKEGKLK